VTEATVRNWTNRGVLNAARLPGSGYRRFDAEQVERVLTKMMTPLKPERRYAPRLSPSDRTWLRRRMATHHNALEYLHDH